MLHIRIGNRHWMQFTISMAYTHTPRNAERSLICLICEYCSIFYFNRDFLVVVRLQTVWHRRHHHRQTRGTINRKFISEYMN